MSNPTKIYNDYVRANLPSTMTFDTTTDRYDINNHSFLSFKEANWYFKYVTKYGYTSLSVYAVNNFDPDLVFDFKQNYYRTGGTETTLSSAITHTRAGQATMVDSDGLLKWAPHNFLTYSSDFTNSSYSKGNVTIGSDNIVAPDGTTTADTVTATGSSYIQGTLNSADTSIEYTLSVWMKVPSGTTSVDMGNIDAGVYITKTVTTDWQLFSVTQTPSATTRYPRVFRKTSGDVTVHIWGAHLYRSDLGGMANNSATGDSYVPTTSSAVYLPRVGHHVYNGSAWVNEGILHESEARANLYLKSNQFVSPWILRGSTITASAGTSPTGLADAWRWVGGGTSLLYQGTSYVAGDYTVSAWVKSNGAGEDTFRLYGLSAANADMYSGNFTATSEWVRYSHTFTSAIVASKFSGIVYGTSQGNVDLLVYGLQIEAGSTPSSYIPTSGSTVTRAADTLTVPVANLPYSSTNMSIQIDGKMTYADIGSSNHTVLPWRWRLDSSNILYNTVATAGTRTGQPRFIQQQATSGYDEVLGANNVYSPNINVPFNLAGRYGSTFINGAHEGTLLTANTTPTALPDLSSTNLELGYIFMGTIGKFRVWNEDLTDTGIAEAST